MALTTGTRVGSYEIVALLGAGGMGEVYRARDTKLEREVAIKVLPELFVSDPERVARFQREAKTLAALNHPHIAQIYGLEGQERRDGQAATTVIVMELVDGADLAQRIADGPIPLDEAVPIARQIAGALEAAHEAGIIHRDLKPANIKLRPDGTVKVLDFGLAKALEPAAASSPNVTASPTITSPAMMTGIGVILGTAAYMSPEQAKGSPADKRSDIWAFGCVLYEMLAGKRAFEGEDVSDTLATILKGEPDWRALPDGLPSSIRRLIRGCLTKNRQSRIGDISTPLFLLRDPFSTDDANGGKDRRFRPGWTGVNALAVVALALTIIGVVVASNLKRPTSAHVVRVPLVLPQDTTFSRTAAHLVAMSPDGTKLAYVANRQLFLRRMSELESRPVQGATGDIAEVFFSPDGEWVGFLSFRDNQLKKIAVTGGAAVTICKAGFALGARWDRDQILFEDPTQGIMRVAAAGGEPSLLVGVKPEEGTLSSPQFIDNGKALIFTLAPRSADRWDRGQTIVQSLGSGERKVVLRGGTDARYVPSGHIIYAVGPNILAVPFDPSTREVKGGPVPVIENVMRATIVSGNVQLAVSDNGVLAYIPGRVENRPNRTLAFVDRAGKVETLAMNPAQYEYPRISPDGSQIAVAVNTGNQPDIWIYEIASGRLRRLTYGGTNSLPIWSRDGQYVVFASERSNGVGLYRHSADGTGADERLTTAEPGSFHTPFSVDPSGGTLVFGIQAGFGEQTGLWSLPLGDAQNRKSVFEIKQFLSDAAFSPDGRWLALALGSSLAAAERQIFVQPYPDLTTKYQITAEDGREPVWTPDGKQLVYVRGSALYVVDIRKEPAFSAGAPVPLPIAKAPQTLIRTRTYDIMPDGKRFLVVVPSGKQDETQSRAPFQINVVLNWFEELKARVPSR